MEEQQKAEIGMRIKSLRDNSAETSRSIAAYCEVSVEAVRNWIAGRGISWEHGEQVAKMFDVEFDWLWRGREKGTTPDPFPADPYAEQFREINEKLDEILKRLRPAKEGRDGGLPAPSPLGPSRPPNASIDGRTRDRSGRAPAARRMTWAVQVSTWPSLARSSPFFTLR